MATDLYAAADPLVSRPAAGAGQLRDRRAAPGRGLPRRADLSPRAGWRGAALSRRLRHARRPAPSGRRRPRTTISSFGSSPELALDRYGRLIEVGEPWCIRLARWFAAQETGALRAAVHRAPRTPVRRRRSSPTSSSRPADCGRGKTPELRAAGRSTRSMRSCPRDSPRSPRFELVLRAEGRAGSDPGAGELLAGRRAPARDAQAAGRARQLGRRPLRRPRRRASIRSAEHVAGRRASAPCCSPASPSR